MTNSLNVSAGGFGFNISSTGGLWSWDVQANNIRNSQQLYQVVNIRSPWGKLVDVDTPVPADVVLAMATAIQQMQDQLAPLLQLSSPGTTTFSVTVTQGDPSSEVAVIPFINAGAFGSFLTATATPGAPWLYVDPKTIQGLDKNASGKFTVEINPHRMLSSNSPYSGQVTLQDNRNVPTTIPITFNVTVLPQPTIALDTNSVYLVYSLSGGAGGAQAVVVTNSGPAGSELNVSIAKVQKCSPWLVYTPTSIGPLGSGEYSPITFSLLTPRVPLVLGTSYENIIISSVNASNSPLVVQVILNVVP